MAGKLQWEKPGVILVKPAGPDCNLQCRYCFYLDKKELFSERIVHRMSDEVLEEMTRQAIRLCGPEVSFAWQGGEPTLMGLEFFEKAIRFQERYGGGLAKNGLQTNGLLLDKQWAKFLARRNFLTGVSLDGPRHIHDHYRLNAGGKGSWRKVHDSIGLLLDAGAPVNALATVTDYSCRFPEEIYRYFKSAGIFHMQFAPCVERDRQNPLECASFSVSAEPYGLFLIRLFDLWLGDIQDGVASVSIRDFDTLFYTYVGMTPPGCTLKERCGTYLTVEHNGDVFPCDFFVEREWRLGNLRELTLEEMYDSSLRQAFGAGKAALPESCGGCRWLHKCWGGCVKDRIRDPRDKGANHFCRAYRMLLEHAHEALTALAALWRLNRRSL